MDIDQTGLTAEGDTFELTEKGYKDISPNSEVIIRADSSYSSKAFIDELLESDYKFVVKGYSSATSKNLAEQILWDAWEEVSPGVYVAEYTNRHVYGDARVVVCEIFTKDGERKYSHLITNIPASELNAIELFHFYNGRQTIEAFFKSCKETYNTKNLRTRKFNGIYAFLWIVFITHNLISLARRILFAGTELVNIGVKKLIEKIGSIPAKVNRFKDPLEIIWPETSKLARLIITCLKPRPVQLRLPFIFDMDNNSI